MKVAKDLMKWVNEGALSFSIHKMYDLSQASDAHDDLEGKLTCGKLNLLV